MQTIRQLAVYSNWNCRFENVDAPVSLEDCEGVILCLDEGYALPEKTVQALLDSELPVFVIGSGGLQQLAPVRHEHGTLVIRLETEQHQNQDLLLKQTDITLLKDRENPWAARCLWAARATRCARRWSR